MRKSLLFGLSHGRQEPTAVTGESLREHRQPPKVLEDYAMLQVIKLAVHPVCLIKMTHTFHEPVSAWEWGTHQNSKEKKTEKASAGEFTLNEEQHQL